MKHVKFREKEVLKVAFGHEENTQDIANHKKDVGITISKANMQMS